MKGRLKFFSSIVLLLLTASCTSVYERIYPTLVDGKYDSEFPYRNSSAQLEEISRSIRMINSIAFYTSYVFDAEKKLKITELNDTNFESQAVEVIYYNRTASGTGTVIFEEQGKVLVLTVAHIVSFPDTVISYHLNAEGSATDYIQSVSIKNRQNNFIPDLPSGGELEIIIIDKNIDVAFLGAKYQPAETIRITTFNYPWGNSSELEWGSFVYVFGFPMNNKMISKGIVSNPGKERFAFLIDAVFNKGFSGGIVLGVRDGVPNFELVGLVKSVPSEYQYFIQPLAKDHDLDFNPLLPYKGDFFIQKEQVLRMGITRVIGIEVVKNFVKTNENYLKSLGYLIKFN